MTLQSKLYYVYSCDLDVRVQVKVGTLEGKLGKPSYEELIRNPSLQHCVSLLQDERDRQQHHLCVTCQVYGDGGAVGGAVSTSYKSFTTRWNWNEWLTLPIKYSELARDATLTLDIWDFHDDTTPHIIGGTTLTLFSKRGVFRKGMYDLKVWPFEHADPQPNSATPGKVKRAEKRGSSEEFGDFVFEKEESEMRRLAKLSKKHRSGLMEKVDWLDRMTFREIEVINEAEKRQTNSLFLMVEFPLLHFGGQEYLLVYFERNGGDQPYHKPYPEVVKVADPELGLENLVEAKHHALTRTERAGTAERELKPNAAARDSLDALLQAPPSAQLSAEQRDLVWKFRFYLSSNKKALGKFLQSVEWDKPPEVRQAVDLLKEWAPMDVEDALQLLSPQYTHPAVRGYAVSRLKQTPQGDLSLYLLQLVQALKYEDFGKIREGTDSSFVQELSISAMKLEGDKAPNDTWPDKPLGASDLDLEVGTTSVMLSSAEELETDTEDVPEQDLATFLISSACKDATLANYLFWYLKVECDNYAAQGAEEVRGVRAMYVAVLARLSRALLKGGSQARRRRAQLAAQQTFVQRLVQVMKAVMKESGNRSKKIEFLKARLSTSDSTFNFAALDALPLPLDPTVKVQQLVVERAHLFNSALTPAKLVFRTTDGRDFVAIFKIGDDLRQDQLVIQLMRLMDKLLRADNLDLRLSPYKVLATSLVEGFVQFIDSTPLSDVVQDWQSVQKFLRFYRPASKDAYGIEAEVVENYVRSCAGYSVISYLLGIGDRHQHNLLLCKDGRLFHVDFGYILGRDPKPLPPPMKLTREMIEGMGGQNSAHWQEFRRLCYTAFIHLRRHANLILNLFGLMVNANIPDIALEPDKAVNKVEERFHLDLDDEAAVLLMQHIIDASISAKMDKISDLVHGWVYNFKQ